MHVQKSWSSSYLWHLRKKLVSLCIKNLDIGNSFTENPRFISFSLLVTFVVLFPVLMHFDFWIVMVHLCQLKSLRMNKYYPDTE